MNAGLKCPACQKPLRPKVLMCTDCDIRVEGPFDLNEFATLSPDDLHFLRIFVLAEGRIRDMEAPLGLSYPTIRARLKQLKERISPAVQPQPTADQPAGKDSPEPTTQALERLAAGEISFDQAMSIIRKGRGRTHGGKE